MHALHCTAALALSVAAALGVSAALLRVVGVDVAAETLPETTRPTFDDRVRPDDEILRDPCRISVPLHGDLDAFDASLRLALNRAKCA